MRIANRVFLGLIIAAVILTALSLFISSGTYLLKNNPIAMDFLAYYTGAQLLLHSPSQLYNLHAQFLIQRQLAPINTYTFIAYVNPPFVPLIFFPLIKLGVLNAYIAWTTTNVILSLLFCYLSYRQLSFEQLYIKIIILICLVTFVPMLTTLLIGQLSIILALIFLITWMLVKKKKNFLSGLVLSFLLIKPQFFILPFIAFLLQRNGKQIFGLFLGVIFLLFLSYVLVGTNGILNFLQVLTGAYQGDLQYDPGYFAQHNLQTLLLILFSTQSISKIHIPWLIAIGAIILPTLFVWTKRFPTHSPPAAFQFALLIVATLLTSPHTHFHDLFLLVVCAIMILSITNKLNPKLNRLFLMLLVIGYLLELTGYLNDMHIQPSSRFVWLFFSVSYMVVLWFMILKTLLKPSKDIL